MLRCPCGDGEGYGTSVPRTTDTTYQVDGCGAGEAAFTAPRPTTDAGRTWQARILGSSGTGRTRAGLGLLAARTARRDGRGGSLRMPVAPIVVHLRPGEPSLPGEPW